MSELTLSGLDRKVAELRQVLAQRDPLLLARTSGAAFSDGLLRLAVWQRVVAVDPADYVVRDAATGAALDLLTQALVAYYLHTADGTRPAGRWIAFTELPEGRFYTRAFQGYTGQKLARAFLEDQQRFAAAAVRLGGEAESFADVAYRFLALPHVPVLAVCWLGDDDFPSSYQLLFDAHLHHQLPTDGCAILGSMLSGRLLHEAGY